MKTNLWNTDVVMKNTMFNLVQDLQVSRLVSSPVPTDVCELRKYNWPSMFRANPYDAKRVWQAQNFLKRYRFRKDLYTPKQLDELSLQKFLDVQVEVGSYNLPSNPGTNALFRRARVILKGILGQYDPHEHQLLCRFGIKATVGKTLKNGYLHDKLSGSISGSSQHIEWFTGNYLPEDPILQDLLGSAPGGFPHMAECDCLNLVFVPKSYKIHRAIAPNTTLGSLYTSGLGLMLRERLRAVGIHIENAQEKHGYLAFISSKGERKLATLDLSSASDMFTFALLRRLLPSQWFGAINKGRISNIAYKGKRYALQSFMTMGIGYTFELETLMFYAVCKAAMDLMGHSGSVRVYGDDIIIPVKCARYVRFALQQCGFKINIDKSFDWGSFRESCGSDYLQGIDVRPASPEGTSENLTRTCMTAFVHKVVNSLLERWDPVELETTLDWLYRFLYLLNGAIFYIPTSFPDDSGVKFRLPGFHYEPWSKEWGAGTTYTFQVPYLKASPIKREVEWLFPYYWNSLKLTRDREETLPVWFRAMTQLTWKKTNSSVWSRLLHSRVRKMRAMYSTHQSSYKRGQTSYLTEAVN